MSQNSSLSKQKRRLSILFSLSIFLIIVALDVGFLWFKYFDYERQETDRLIFQAQGIAKIVSENPNLEQDLLNGRWFPFPLAIRKNDIWPSMDGWKKWERRGIQLENFFLYATQDGKILFSPRKDDETYTSILQELKWEQLERETSFTLNGGEYRFLNVSITNNISALIFTESRMTVGSVLSDILIYLLGAILLSLCVYIISSRFIESTLAPVEQNMNDMEQFIHNAGHELKTPLSVIKSSLELMKLKKNYDEGIMETIGELNRMNGLIQALISLSSMGEHGDSELINTKETCEKLAKNYGEKLEEKNISLEIIEKKPLTIKANREYTEILISNILSNAIKYNITGGKITITIHEKNIEIKDTGIGIEKENIWKVFDRFYQESEGRDENSFGIGLSLVKKITDLYKWTISIESEKNIGTTVKILF